jgi:hypothetical protein
LLESALITLLIGAQIAAQTAPTYRLERQPVAGGAELVTLFGPVHTLQADSNGGEIPRQVPLMAVLRDTLGDSDPRADRLRYVWILTRTRPTPVQRLASALTFFWFRTGSQPRADRVPSPVLDLASPAKGVWINVLSSGLQSWQLDPLGVTVRSSTRSYRGNSSDYRQLKIYEALGALDGLERQSSGENFAEAALPDSEFRELYSRLSLSTHLLGGLVREQNLSKFYDKETSRLEEMRGHNWELLRQRAETAGLYFDPLALPGETPTQALLWVSRSDLEEREGERFDGQFLHIANPWTDQGLRNWNGYAETRYFDADNQAVSADEPGARAVELIPLALYSLDYPKVPLLLVDFRHGLKPKGRELVGHTASSILTGIFGITRFSSLSFFAADATWTFVRGRHGAATNRSARLRSYAEAREFVAVDSSLQPKLRVELLSRLDHLALNPLENALTNEAKFAEAQYAALLQYASVPAGLPAKLERDRRHELEADQYTRGTRIRLALGHWFKGEPSSNREEPNLALHTELDSRRRAAADIRYLERVVASSPTPDVIRDPRDIRQTVDALSEEAGVNPRAAHLIARIFSSTSDYDLRTACLRALGSSHDEQARIELVRLSEDANTNVAWRMLCRQYLNDETASSGAAALGEQ